MKHSHLAKHLTEVKRTILLTNYQTTEFLDMYKTKIFAGDYKKVKSKDDLKTFWGKEKMLLTCIFSSLHNVFKSLVSQVG